MIALILAGGLGTRLSPHTDEIPKPLLEVNGKAILAHQIETLHELGINKIVIVTGHLNDKIESFVLSNFPEKNIVFAHNSEYRDSKPAYGIIASLPHLDEDSIYLNGDVFYDKEILKMIVEDTRGSITAIQKTPWDEEQVNVILKEDSIIELISKKIPEDENHGEFIGVTKLTKDFIEKIKSTIESLGKENFRYHFAIDLLNHVTNNTNTPIYALDVTELKAIEIDTPEDYIEAKEKFNE